MLSLLLPAAAFLGVDRAFFLPGKLSGAHDRFGAACDACHESWEGPSEPRCLNCHADFLATDTHGSGRLAHPVRARVPEELSSLGCVNCHREHRPQAPGGYTGPAGFCVECHPSEQPGGSHIPFRGEGCRDAGCHSYHQNVTRAEAVEAEPVRLLAATGVVARQDARQEEDPAAATARLAALRQSDFYRRHPEAAARYEIGAHAGTEADCTRCHEPKGGFTLAPPPSVCGDCHKEETASFSHGDHGAAASLRGIPSYRQPAVTVGCGSCHDVHSVRLEGARREACQRCHGGEHVANYKKSGHFRYLTDPVFAHKDMKGVDCAGCHLPRRAELGGAVDHNESLAVGSHERMARTVCVRCHGLRFALAALADEGLVRSSFTGRPLHEHAGVALRFAGLPDRPVEPDPAEGEEGP